MLPHLQGGLLDACDAVAGTGADVGVPVLQQLSQQTEGLGQAVLQPHVEVLVLYSDHLYTEHELEEGHHFLN